MAVPIVAHKSVAGHAVIRSADGRNVLARAESGKTAADTSSLDKQTARLALRTAAAEQDQALAWGVGGVAVLLVLLVLALWERRNRLKEMSRRTLGDYSVDSADETKSLSQLLSVLKNPLLIFLALTVAYYTVPLFPFLSETIIQQNYLRLCLVVIGVYIAAELVFITVVDYFFINIQKVEIPRIFYQMIKILAFVLVYLPILSTQFSIDITPLLTTSAVLTMVVGLALQDSLGNLFSGIAMQLSNPFKVGDWVLVAGREGRVTEVNWRATTIKTFSNDYVIIPNSSISKTEIHNFSRPTKVHARFLPIGLSYTDSPERVERVLVDTVLSVDGVLPRPKPQVMLQDYGDFTINYMVKFFLLDFSRYPTIESNIRRRLWYALRRAKMEIPFPIRTVNMTPPSSDEEEQHKRAGLLTKVDFLLPISDNGLRELARALEEQLYPTGFDIVVQGDVGDTFYIIRSGRAKVIVDDGDGREGLTLAELGPGQFFGEMSLLTGERRMATVRTIEECSTLTLDKETFKRIMQKEPKLAEKISEVIVNRRKATADEIQRRDGDYGDSPGKMSRGTKVGSSTRREQQNLLKKIILFFGM